MDTSRLTRRQALKIGGAAALTAPILTAGTSPGVADAGPARVDDQGAPVTQLPIADIERITRVKGTVSNNVLDLTVERTDLPHVVTTTGIPVKPGFQINGDVFFEALHDGSAIMNGDLCFVGQEIDGAIDQMLAHGLVLQAEHQHLWDLHYPRPWFMHFRGQGDPRALARGVAAVLGATATPLPQAPPAHPTTPLDADRLGRIIGAPPTVGSDGVVSFQVPQRRPIRLGGVTVNPYLNIATPIAFEPLGGDRAAVVPDYGMFADQIEPVMRLMRSKGWLIGCLYNQETDEYPQLYFSHQLKVGDAYELAKEVRAGLELTDVVLSS